MFVRRATVFVLAGVFAACSGESGNQAEQGMAEHATETVTPEQSLRNLSANYMEAANAHNSEMVAGLYEDSAVVLSADGTIAQGRDQILAMEQAGAETPANLTITPAEEKVEGEFGVERGTYSVTLTPAGGAATTQSGAYMTLNHKVGDAWKISILLTNFDATPPAGFPYVKYTGETPKDNGTLTDLIANWKKHYDLGHANMVADFYTDDAKASFGGGPTADGKAAIEAALTATMADRKPQITIHDVFTQPFGTDYVVDGGYWSTTVGGKPDREGEYLLLGQKQADGSVKIVWHYGNGRPAQM
jgi:uncharacterized protein (TIGR02246 family)